jgi:hypothetical protein
MPKPLAERRKRGSRTGYAYLHSAIDGYSRLAFTEVFDDERAITAVEFLTRARAWFAATASSLSKES